MSERYTKLFTLPENLYTEGAPVVISAGALLKDNQTGKVLAQLKIKNISNNTIKAAKIKISPFDTVGNPIDEEIDHEYLDLNVKRDDEFGQKAPIAFSNSSTRAFLVQISEVIFSDNSIWNGGGYEWSSIVVPEKLEVVFDNYTAAIQQYKRDYGRNMLTKDRDLWICSCGNINKSDEPKCHFCKSELAALELFNADEFVDELNQQLEEKKRLAEERRKQEEIEKAEKIAKAKKISKKVAKICAVVIPIIIVLVIAGNLISNYVQKNSTYKSALASYDNITNSETKSDDTYKQIISTLESLDGFKESEEYILNVKYDYASYLATSHFYLKEAISIYKELGDFKDSKDKLKEATYNQAVKDYESKDYNSAIKKFESLGDYKDSKKRINDCTDMLTCENFATSLSKSIMNASVTEIKKLSSKNATAKKLYNIYKKYKPYCGAFKCVTKGDLKGDKIKSDFQYTNDRVYWIATSVGRNDPTIKHAPFYFDDGSKNIGKTGYSVLDFNTAVTNMLIRESYSDGGYYNNYFDYVDEYKINCSVKFKNNQIIYSSKHSDYNKTLTLKYTKTK